MVDFTRKQSKGNGIGSIDKEIINRRDIVLWTADLNFLSFQTQMLQHHNQTLAVCEPQEYQS